MSGYQGYNQTEYTGANTDGGFYRTSESAGTEGGSSQRSLAKTYITPVTIKQILDSEQHVADGPYVVNNLELGLVSFVGIVRNIIDNSTNILILLEDGTGKFEFRKWTSDTADNGNEEDSEMKDDSNKELEIGKYVYITGSLKDFNQKKNIQYPTIKPIEDFNAVLYHYLEAIKVHAEAQGLSAGKSAAEKSDSLFVSAPAHEELDISERVFNLIKDNTPSMPDGVPVQYIQQRLNLSINDVMEQCTILEEKAKIYSGIEDETYLAV